MTTIFALSALIRLVFSDPFQAYDFTCVLHRPDGQQLTVSGSMRGRDAATRVASVSGSSREFAYGSGISVRLEMNDSGAIDRETFNIARDDVHYHYSFERSLPFEQQSIGLTVVGFDVATEPPGKVSAMGFCTTKNVLPQGSGQ